LKLMISNASQDPIYEQIVKQLKAQIIGGELGEGDALPSIRKLAQDLGISVITSKRAYEELEREGFIDTVGGKGTFVAAQNREFLREKRMRMVEEKLEAAINEARMTGIGRDDLVNLLRLLWKEDE
jgi:GntR family transcriptional regulator